MRACCRWLSLAWTATSILLSGCSLMFDPDTTQCTKDSDCVRFDQTVCDRVKRVCMAASGSSEGGEDGGAPDAVRSCRAASGCFQCTATTDQELLSSCTDSTCIPFDNGRLTNLNPDGTLKALP